MYAIVINKQGFKVEFVVLDEDKQPLYYELKQGESVIEEDWQVANSMNKPQWNGSEWIDTDPLPPVPPIEPQPSDSDKIIVLESEIERLIQENEQLKQQHIENQSRIDATENAVLELMTKATV